MHPRIRSLCLTITLTLLSLAELSALNLTLFESSIALGQTTGRNSREVETKSIAAESAFRLSQKTSATAAHNPKTLFDEGMRLLQQQTAESSKAAISKFEEAAQLYAVASDRKMQATCLFGMGRSYDLLGEKQRALKYFNQSLLILRAVGDRVGEATALNDIGLIHSDLREHQKALAYLNQSLPLWRAIGDHTGEVTTLNNMGRIYNDLGEKQKALEYYNQSLSINQAVGNRAEEAKTLNVIGFIYDDLGAKQKALEYYNQSLSISQAIGDRAGEAITLNNIGLVYNDLGEKQTALQYYNQSLPTRRAVGDRAGEATTLNNIGLVYSTLGEKQKALEYYNQSLPISRAVGNRTGEAATLNNIGKLYFVLGENQKALKYYNQSLPLLRAVGNLAREASILKNIGMTYSNLGEKQRALQYYNQALPISREVGDRTEEASTLSSIGAVYGDLGEKQRALQYYNQALPISREVGDRTEEARILNNIGLVYNDLGEKQTALQYYNQSLPISRLVGDRAGEANTLSNIGWLLELQKQPTLAISLYKQFVNLTEALRNDIRSLPKELQATYAQTISNGYQRLVNLLLQQDRILEALQVLDLLKVQELQDFLKDVKGNERTVKGIEILPEEQQILAQLNSSKVPDFNDYLTSPAINKLSQQLQKTAAAQNLKLTAYQDLQTRLQGLSARSALLYPLILNDRLELVLFTPNVPPTHYTIEVSEKELSQSILSFRQALQRPTDASILSPAQQLYTWLLKPLEADLKKANIQTIIYAPDGQLRYIPLGALHDGQKWAIENHQINYVTAFGLTSLKPKSTQTPRILAGAYNNSRLTSVTVNQKQFQFGPIPAAVPEVKNLAAKFPQTTLLLDGDFNRTAINPDRMNKYSIIHLATHGKLVDGSPEDSFVLLNNGEYVTLREIKDWKLPNVGLVVLSACQTALGEKLGSGIEIIGLGYQLQVAQARASIASLWEVSDDGTNSLMNLFYEQLQQGKRSSTEALAEAQRAMIQQAKTVGRSDRRGSIKVVQSPDKRQPPFSHPYYWAPFILIGNGM
jgi:CHAT domain-containing protein/Flp pilus assembly protein TadD